MKKITILEALFLLMAGGLAAQEPDSIMQPVHVVGKAYDNTTGQTVSYSADFEYYEDGKLWGFIFPVLDDNPRWTRFYYNNGFLTDQITGQYMSVSPYFFFSENKVFRYNSQGCLTYSEETRGHEGGEEQEEIYNGQYYNYYYDQYNRITRKELGTIDLGEPEDYQYYWIYEHEEGGKKVTISKYKKEWQGTELVSPHIDKVFTYLYSDDYNLLSIQEDSYTEGEITWSTLQLYSYNDEHQLQSMTKQYPIDGEWTTICIDRYYYDEAGRRIKTIHQSWVSSQKDWVNATIGTVTYNDAGQVTEIFSGIWSEELGDWQPSKKTVYEYDYDNSLYIISFWKYKQEQWLRDYYYLQQTLLFGKELDKQQNCLSSMTYGNLYNQSPFIYYYQFEITMERMKRPEYLSAEEKEATACAVFPNPGRDNVTVKAPVENAVVRFYDMQGRLLHAQPFDFQTDIHAGGWATGIYLWEIWDGPNRAATGKWIKE